VHPDGVNSVPDFRCVVVCHGITFSLPDCVGGRTSSGGPPLCHVRQASANPPARCP
jgi:hypothetical protein